MTRNSIKAHLLASIALVSLTPAAAYAQNETSEQLEQLADQANEVEQQAQDVQQEAQSIANDTQQGEGDDTRERDDDDDFPWGILGLLGLAGLLGLKRRDHRDVHVDARRDGFDGRRDTRP